MGLEIDRERFSADDYARFEDRLARCLGVLGRLLERSEFGEGDASLGAELVVALVDAQAKPLPLNEEVLRETLDERMTVELDRFNLECNLRHTTLAGRPFTHLAREIDSARAELTAAAGRHGVTWPAVGTPVRGRQVGDEECGRCAGSAAEESIPLERSLFHRDESGL